MGRVQDARLVVPRRDGALTVPAASEGTAQDAGQVWLLRRRRFKMENPLSTLTGGI